MKNNQTYLPLKRHSAGPFFKSILAEIYFTIYSEIGLSLHGGVPYRSIVYLVNRVASTDKQSK